MPEYIRAFIPEDTRAAVAQAKPGTPIRFVASTDLTARDGLKIPISSWRTEEYLSNPIVLVNHNFQAMPIGRTVKLDPGEHALFADIEFDQQDEEARAVESKIRRGFVNSCSVSWDTILREGDTVKEANLLDISIVSVPADPRALAERQRRGLAEMAHDLLRIIEPDPSDPVPTQRADDPAPEPATWEQSAERMVRLFYPVALQSDDERITTYKQAVRDYGRLRKVPPEYRSQDDLAALGPSEVRGLFLEGEPDLFPEFFAWADSRAGAVLSARNRDSLEQAISLISGVLASAKKEAKADDDSADDAERAADDPLALIAKAMEIAA